MTSPTDQHREKAREVEQHIAWLHQYVSCMKASNFADLRDYTIRQLDRLTETVTEALAEAEARGREEAARDSDENVERVATAIELVEPHSSEHYARAALAAIRQSNKEAG